MIVERRIQNDRSASYICELGDQPVISQILTFADGLGASRIVGRMQDCLDVSTLFRLDIERRDHERCWLSLDQVLVYGFLQYRGGKRPPFLPVFDEPVYSIARLDTPRVGENASVSECSGTEFETTVEPPDESTVYQTFGDVSFDIGRFAGANTLEAVRVAVSDRCRVILALGVDCENEYFVEPGRIEGACRVTQVMRARLYWRNEVLDLRQSRFDVSDKNDPRSAFRTDSLSTSTCERDRSPETRRERSERGRSIGGEGRTGATLDPRPTVRHRSGRDKSGWRAPETCTRPSSRTWNVSLSVSTTGI